MAELIFSLRFQSQLRRTQPVLLRRLEQSVTETIEGFAGRVSVESKLLRAFFDEDAIGFALDLVCVLENLKRAIEEAAPELYGYACVLGKNIRDTAFTLTQQLPVDRWHTGIWCDAGMRAALSPFAGFDQPLDGPDYAPPLCGYARLRDLPEFLPEHAGGAGKDAGGARFPWNVSGDNSEMINKYLKQGALRNTVIVGAEFTGKREGLRRFCTIMMNSFPPLVIRFGYAHPLVCIIDCFTPEIQSILRATDVERLASWHEALSRERLREEFADFFIKKAAAFFAAFLEAYKSAAGGAKVHPVLILENVQECGPLARTLIADAYASLPRGKFYLYGTCTDIAALKLWEDLFPRIIKFSPVDSPEDHAVSAPVIPSALWEMVYACALFTRYFPAYLVPRLFSEEGKNPLMIEKAFALLLRLRLVTSDLNPFPRHPDLAVLAEQALGAGAEKIRVMVRKRLLAWVSADRLKPCYRLLEALSSLGGKADAVLMLKSICADVIEGVYQEIDQAVESGAFEAAAGVNSVPLLSIFRTHKALAHGSPEDIKAVFMGEPAEAAGTHPVFRAWIQANRTCFNLGVCDFEAATASVKETMLITQQENNGLFISRVYRLFSLVNFFGNHLPDAIDYFTFATEDAEKAGSREELALILLYSSSAYFIFGNLSKAERLIVQAEEAALASGQPGWADRCKFFHGRICFEVGRYEEALHIFTSLETEYCGAGSPDFTTTLAAWIYRVKTYLPSSGTMSVPLCFDARLFEIENAYLSGDYHKTLELASSAGDVTSKDRFLYIEQPDWRSGFAQCELFLFPLRDLWNRIFLTFRALALCHVSATAQNAEDFPPYKDEAIREMRYIMREELPDTDPNAAFYFYSYYQVLQLSGAPEVDMNTAISLAFKRLQRRASRIDDNETRRTFLTRQYWNSDLEKTAREHKLI